MDAMELNRRMVDLKEQVKGKLYEQITASNNRARDYAIEAVMTTDPEKKAAAESSTKLKLAEVDAFRMAIEVVNRELETVRTELYQAWDKPAVSHGPGGVED